ncbi:hypothetical protein Vadar_002914 [Vaccinium darrowii]|uniref:Uncharacterized protein n=1 Tax=Vaccinium darrowii TaxID=229202 RepID=A0ACB7ZGU8_9ERIC|nr:hypothetical protein Vadar_002914 [Vaccinium darrowii]
MYALSITVWQARKFANQEKTGQAKVLGAVVCVGGAMLLSFYHGSVVIIGGSSIHWKYADKIEKGNSGNTTHDNNFILGAFLLLASTMSWGAWLVIQAKMGLNYSAPCTSSALICLMASIECGILASTPVADAGLLLRGTTP